MKTRIYRVETTFAQPAGGIVVRNHLVEANSRQQAERHIASQHIVAEIAKPQDIVDLMTKGSKVEQARADTETAELPLGETK